MGSHFMIILYKTLLHVLLQKTLSEDKTGQKLVDVNSERILLTCSKFILIL